MNKQTPPPPSLPKLTNRSQYSTTAGSQNRFFKDWGRVLTGVWAIAAAAATTVNLGVVQSLERQLQTLFFEVRGPVEAPQEVVILAIDESSMKQEEFFLADPNKYAHLEPLRSWPWKRVAYAEAIDKLMAAGAKAVGVDIIFSNPSSYGEEDDRQFAETLRRHAGRVVLASQYDLLDTPQGPTVQISTPQDQLCDSDDCRAYINVFLEPDGRVHRYGEEFFAQLSQDLPPVQANALERLPVFATATLRAAGVKPPSPENQGIYFYGPPQTFEHIPFWQVLDPATWNTTLESGAFFKDKIVLIGATAAVHQDFHAAPFSRSLLYPKPMAGVEIHANAVASLLQGSSITDGIPQAWLKGAIILLGVGVAGWAMSRPKQPLRRFLWGTMLAIAWTGAGYILFTQARWILPTAVPAGAIALSGVTQLVAGTMQEQTRKNRLRDTLKQYVTSPIVQEIISQQDDLMDLLRERELEVAGKVLSGRYRIVRVLGSGGFSETYVAEDLQRPGNPDCVVKRLRVVSNELNTLKLARRLFATEAETLERLGEHEQIPRLLASFEENHEFYLVQEFIEGHPLAKEMLPLRSMPQIKVVYMLLDLLEVLAFVHSEDVIHRDLKPSNIIRRRLDGRLVLIDFGVAKRITTQLAETSGNTRFTVAVGTPGYTPAEQSAGRPHFNSDIYALGMIAIEALSGRPPHSFNHDALTGAVLWKERVPNLHSGLVEVLDKMLHHDFIQRYRSVQEVQFALKAIASDLGELDVLLEDPEQQELGFELETADLDEESLGETIPLPENWVDHP